MNHYTQFKIEQLRAKNLARLMESILAFLGALFVTALLPSILVRYVYSPEQLMQQPPALLEYIPIASFAVAFGYLVFAAVGNMKREKTARELEKQLELTGGHMGCECDCGDHDMVSDEELKELEAIVDEALSESKTAAAAKKDSAKKSKTTKKAASKKTAKKSK